MVVKALRPIRVVVLEAGDTVLLIEGSATAAAVRAARDAGKGKVTIRGVEVPIGTIAVVGEDLDKADALALDGEPPAD